MRGGGESLKKAYDDINDGLERVIDSIQYVEIEKDGEKKELITASMKSVADIYVKVKLLNTYKNNLNNVSKLNDNEMILLRNKRVEGGGLNNITLLGIMYEYGIGVPQNYDEAFRCYQNGARLKDINSMNSLADMYKQGRGAEQDDDKALYWYIQAAESGSTRAMKSLEAMYEDGDGVPQNQIQADYWYTKVQEVE